MKSFLDGFLCLPKFLKFMVFDGPKEIIKNIDKDMLLFVFGWFISTILFCLMFVVILV